MIRKLLHIKLSLIFLLLCIASSSFAQNSLVGSLAPEFKLQDQNGQWHTLEKYKGKWLVVYFYPKDDTPGCTTEAKNFRDRFAQFQELDTHLIGVSLDDIESHKEFADIYKLPFPLLADVNQTMSKSYGVLGGFGPLKYAKRQTFIIDGNGNIVFHFEEVVPEEHANAVIEKLQQLQKDLT